MVEGGADEKRIELESIAGVRGESGDELAADAVAWVVAGFEECNVDADAAEREAERETGEAAADDFDGAEGSHERRTATK